MKKLKIALVLVLLSNVVIAQDAVNIESYKKAVSFMWGNINNKKVFNLYIQANWFADSSGFWFEHNSPGLKEYRQYVFETNQTSPLFDHDKIAKILQDSLGKEIKANNLPISRIKYIARNIIEVESNGKTFKLSTLDYTVLVADKKEELNQFEKDSPNKKWTAYAKDYNLYIKAEDGNAKQLSSAGKKNYEYGSYHGWADIMKGENAIRPEHFSVNWSPDSKWLSSNICDLKTANKMYLLDWSIDSLYRPDLLSYYRGSPGDTNMIYMEPVFFNSETGEEFKPKNSRATHINNTDVQWSDQEDMAYIIRTKRGYQEITISLLNLKTKTEELLIKETSPTNLDNFSFRINEKSGHIFYLSEKSGWRQLYAYDLKSKKNTGLTKGEFFINQILEIDHSNKKILFLASGKDAGKNPYLQDLYSIGFNGKKLNNLTNDNLHHQVSISPNGKYFFDNASSANVPTQSMLRAIDGGQILVKISSADITKLAGWSPPELFEVLARDGKTKIYGSLWKPTNFDDTKLYPIIDHSYTGPHTQVFPKDFRRVLAGGNQSYAELGFIVMMVDGLGSSGRSKEFHDYSYKNLGGNLEDHIGAIRQLSKSRSWIDTTRVGIFGHSAGGYDAGHAVLAYPDFYKVAVASSADHDHRMEKAWWPEMYMGWPVDSAYHLQSNITMAGNLKGKLLITHGGIDENVNPSASFKLAEALIKNDKQFDMLILPSQHHGYRGQHGKYFTKTRWNYFVKHLLNAEPIWEFAWE